jgi:LysR family hydrogen peroxide-inducible transcriptional activator
MQLGPQPFTLRQLQYAVAVAESLSFRQAAEHCHVSQPALSAQLAQMEAALGVPLFERDRRRVLMTAAGREIIERARLILREADDLVEVASCNADPLSGTLRIGVIPTISPYLLPRLGIGLREAYPHLTTLWVEDKSGILVEGLERGTLDAALLALEADIGDVERETIGSDSFVLATPKGHPLGDKASSVKPPELQDVSVLLLDEGHCFREQALVFCSQAKARELEFRATSLSTLAQVVAGGAGVTLLPELAVATEVKRAELSIRRFTQPEPKRTIALVWRRRSPLGPALRQLATTARTAYEHMSASGAGHKGPRKHKTARHPP